MSTRGSRLEARNQREPVAQEARVKSWEKRCVRVCVWSRDGALVRGRARARERQKRDALCARARGDENVGFLARIALERARGDAHVACDAPRSRFASRRLTERVMRDATSFRRWVDGAEKNKTKFYKWMPVIDANGVDVESRARGAAGSRYEVIPTPVTMDADDA